MGFTPIEIIAGIFAALTIIKMIVILVNKKSWFNFTEKVYGGSTMINTVIFAVLGLVVLYYLLQVLSLVQIYAVLGFMVLLMAVGFLQYSKEMMPFVKKIYHSKFSFTLIIYALIWMALSVLVLLEVFGYGVF